MLKIHRSFLGGISQHSLMRVLVLTVFVLFVGSASNVIAQERIKIGVSIPLTGPVADYGIAIANGMKLAIEEVDTLHRIELKF